MASNCTGLINGRRVLSCLMLATDNYDAHVTTIEGLVNHGALLAYSC
jgi:aerobic-type carbon monoxide dehydrogenase small subunit (CoxS/CutS family)